VLIGWQGVPRIRGRSRSSRLEAARRQNVGLAQGSLKMKALGVVSANCVHGFERFILQSVQSGHVKVTFEREDQRDPLLKRSVLGKVPGGPPRYSRLWAVEKIDRWQSCWLDGRAIFKKLSSVVPFLSAS
jgi:hypothetical protein